MKYLILMVPLVILLAYCNHANKPEVVLEKVAQYCTQQCKSGGYEWSSGLHIDENSNAFNCFCNRGKK